MHVLFLTDNFPPETNAPASRTHEHARRWVAAGHEVTVITCAPNFPAGRVHDGYRNRLYQTEVIDGIRVVRVKTFITANAGFLLRTLDYMSFMVMGFLGALLQRRPDVVVATSPQFFTACAGWAVSVFKRRPFVFELRDIWPASIEAVGASKGGRLIRALERVEMFLYRRARAIVAVTHSFKHELIRRGIDGSKIEVVTNGVDLSRYSPVERSAPFAKEIGVEGKFVVGYVGTHGMAHALDNVLEAADRLRDRDDVHFLLVGDGAARASLLERAQELGLENVTLHPPLPKDRMREVWGLCDVALVHLRDTPLFETVIPSKMFEAMGMGVPILIACPEGEATGIVRDTGAGEVVAPEDPEALAASVAGLADDHERVTALGMTGLRSAPRFSRDRLAATMLDHLHDVAGVERPVEFLPEVELPSVVQAPAARAEHRPETGERVAS